MIVSVNFAACCIYVNICRYAWAPALCYVYQVMNEELAPSTLLTLAHKNPMLHCPALPGGHGAGDWAWRLKHLCEDVVEHTLGATELVP